MQEIRRLGNHHNKLILSFILKFEISHMYI
jgi:hypothetical protein